MAQFTKMTEGSEMLVDLGVVNFVAAEESALCCSDGMVQRRPTTIQQVQVKVKPEVIDPALSSVPESLDIQIPAVFVGDHKVIIILDSRQKNVFCVAQYLKYPLAILNLRMPFFLPTKYVLGKAVVHITIGRMTKMQNRTLEEIKEWYKSEGITAKMVTTHNKINKCEENLHLEQQQQVDQEVEELC